MVLSKTSITLAMYYARKEQHIMQNKSQHYNRVKGPELHRYNAVVPIQ